MKQVDGEREKKRLEKVEKLKLKGRAMIARAKQIESKEKQKERKERARELIEIGAIVAQFHDRKKLLEYLKKDPRMGIQLSNSAMFSLSESEKKLAVGDTFKLSNGEEHMIMKKFIHLGWVPI